MEQRWYLARLGGVLIAVEVVFLIGILVGSAVPDRAILENLDSDFTNGELGPDRIVDRFGGKADGFTDCVIAGTGLGRSKASFVQRAVYMPMIGSCEPAKKKTKELLEGHSTSFDSYMRYWAGYVSFVRPLEATFGFSAVRIVGVLSLLGSISLLLYASRRWLGSIWHGTVMLIPLLVSSNLFALPTLAFGHSITMALAIGSCGLAVILASKYAARGAMLAGILGGSVVNYLDLFTTPEIGWAFMAFGAAAALVAGGAALRKVVVVGFASAAAWGIGYVFTWCTRWLIDLVAYGPSAAWKNIGKSLLFRLGGEESRVNRGFGNGMSRTLSVWLGTSDLAWPVLVVSVLVVVGVIAAALVFRKPGRLVLLVALVASIGPIVFWLEVVTNHSQIHAFFVYRCWPAVSGILLAGSTLVISQILKLVRNAPGLGDLKVSGRRMEIP